MQFLLDAATLVILIGALGMIVSFAYTVIHLAPWWVAAVTLAFAIWVSIGGI